MEVKKGYKLTEVGVIPEDWEVKKLGEFSNPVRGGSPRPAGSTKFFNGNFIPWLTVASLTNIPSSQLYVSETDSCLTEEGSLLSRILKKGTLIIANSGATLGIAKLLSMKCCANDGIAALLEIKKDINKEYIVYYINTKTKYLREVVATGNGQPNLNTDLISNMKIPIPPILAEQAAIATALSDTDALIQSLERLIAKKCVIKQGVMQELLTGKKRLTGFGRNTETYKQTELGVIPLDWEVKKLGEISEITKLAGFEYSKYFNSYKGGGDIIVIRGTNISYNKLDLSDIKTIPCETSNNLQRSKLRKNDIVFAYVGTIGPVYLIEENNKYHLGPNTSKITINKLNSPKFLYIYFTSWLIQSEIIEHTSVGAQPSLSMSKIRSFKIIMPPTLEEQTAIATVLSDMDAELAALETKLAKCKQVKQGMMQNLLTGRIRLI